MVDKLEYEMKREETKDDVFFVKSMYMAFKIRSTKSFRCTSVCKSFV